MGRAALIELVVSDTRELLSTLSGWGEPRRFERPTMCAPCSGVITQIDTEALVRIASAGDCVLTPLPALGEFVPASAPLFEIEGSARKIDERAVIRCLELGPERTLQQDLAYGLRMLVDIAERSVSESSFLDPTTAVQAIDRLHD